MMCRLAEDCPGYGFEVHKGYGVPQHMAALNELGPSIHHRSLFAPVVAARLRHQAGGRAADLIKVQTTTDIEISA
jgi:ribonuclease HII